MDDTGEIERLIEARIAALERKDGAAANAVLDKDLVAFELAGPLQLPSALATDNGLTQEWLDSFDSGPRVIIEELSIHAGGDVAFCHSLNRLQGKRNDGTEIDLTMRSTLGFKRTGGEWKIIHAHSSLPR
jgi:ketosteroid isomerase-like protein